MLRRSAAEFGWTGSLSTLLFQWLLRGKTGQRLTCGPRLPCAIVATASAASRATAMRPRVILLDRTGWSPPPAIARPRPCSRPCRRRRGRPQARHPRCGPFEPSSHPPAMHEVELLLLVVVVPAGLVPRRDLDGADAERRDAQGAPDLPKAGLIGEGIHVGGRPALPLHDLANLLGHHPDRTPGLPTSFASMAEWSTSGCLIRGAIGRSMSGAATGSGSRPTSRPSRTRWTSSCSTRSARCRGKRSTAQPTSVAERAGLEPGCGQT